MRNTKAKASPAYKALRARLIEKGMTLRSFAAAHGLPYPTVYCAARGTRAGIKSVQIRRRLEEVANA